MSKIKIVNQIIIGVFVVIAVTAVIGYTISSRIPKIPEPPKTIKIDAEEAGRKLRDLKNDFLKGYNDTTSIKKDSIE